MYFPSGIFFDGGAYASKYFYSDASYAVASELAGDAGAYFSYDLNFLKLGAGGDFLFSTGTDISVNFNLSHSFEMGPDSGKWTISPTAQIGVGTQSFYRAYYKNRKFSFGTTTGNGGSGSSHGKGHHTTSGGTSTGTTKTLTFLTQNQFTVLDRCRDLFKILIARRHPGAVIYIYNVIATSKRQSAIITIKTKLHTSVLGPV